MSDLERTVAEVRAALATPLRKGESWNDATVSDWLSALCGGVEAITAKNATMLIQWLADTDAAYARGADEMRERAAKVADVASDSLAREASALIVKGHPVRGHRRLAEANVALRVYDAIRALPSAPDGPSPSPEVFGRRTR